jgi:AcrR family transcriptional regulator
MCRGDSITVMQTRLQHALADQDSRPRAAPIDAFKLARRRFLAGDVVDVTSVAAELGVNRVTVQRWVGSRSQLLVEVLWSLAERQLEHARALVAQDDPGSLAEVFALFIGESIAHPGMRRFLHEEGPLAMRLLTRPDQGFHPRMVAAFQRVLQDAAAVGELEPDAPLEELAYTLVRIMEGYVHTEALGGDPPQPERIGTVLRWILRPPGATP